MLHQIKYIFLFDISTGYYNGQFVIALQNALYRSLYSLHWWNLQVYLTKLTILKLL